MFVKFIQTTTVVLLAAQIVFASPKNKSIAQLKKDILTLAESYQGQGDPDQSKQATLDILVEELIQKKPPLPVADRLGVIEGVWKQVWGPYEYRNDDGSIDPTIGINEIYQVVFSEGYYYNVAPIYEDADPAQERIGLLRGEFEFDEDDELGLKVDFTNYPGVDPRPTNMPIWDLAAIAEAGELENEVTIVPKWIVKLFFRGGKLEEVYTDQDLRLLYGTSNKKNARRSLYVMTRVKSF